MEGVDGWSKSHFNVFFIFLLKLGLKRNREQSERRKQNEEIKQFGQE